MKSVAQVLYRRLRATSALAPVFSPSSLFAASEPGAWYDPSDIERYTATTGPELVTNGDFSSGATGWTATDATVSAVSGGLQVTSIGTVGRIVQNINTVVGKTYRFTCRYTPNSGDRALVNIRSPNEFGPVMVGLPSATFTPGTFVGFFVANATTAAIRLQAFDNGDVVLFDDVSVKEAPEFGTATMFQDSLGTIPVTAVEQPVGLIEDKSGTINSSNLVSNGTFTTNTTGWTAVSGAIAAVSGELEVTGSGGSYPRAEQTYNLVVGKTYRISATARRGTATGNAYIAHTSGALYAETSSTTNVTLTYTFTATTVSHTAVAGVFASGVTGTAYFDNFVIEEINPAFQATPGSRPVLSARVNALTYTETFSNAAWTKTNTTVSQVSGAVWEVNEGTATGNHLVFQTVSQNLAAFGFAIDVRAGNASPWVRLTSRSNYVTNYLDFNLADQQQINENGTTTAYTNPTWTVTPLSDGWYRLQIRSDGAINEAGARALTLAILDSSRNLSYTGTSRTIQIRRPQIEAGNQNSTYQRVGAATDYDTTGFPLYLRDDLVDDTLNWKAPAGTYTVAFVDHIGNVTIETSQSLSGTTDMLRVQRLCGYLAIGRALTASETTDLTAWLKSKSGGVA